MDDRRGLTPDIFTADNGLQLAGDLLLPGLYLFLRILCSQPIRLSTDSMRRWKGL